MKRKVSNTEGQVTDSIETSDYADSQILGRVTGILSVLSKDDALSIFLSAKDSLSSDTNTHYKIGITRKQYYTRLKQLVDFGILTKNEKGYVHTAFGSIVYKNHFLGLVHNIKNQKELEMIDVLRSTSKFDNSEIFEFINKVSLSHPDLGSLTITKPSTITTSYEEMITNVLEMMEFAQKEIFLISRFTNEIIINTMIKKANMGVDVKVLADTKLVEGFIENTNGKVTIEDKNKTERINVVVNPYYPTKIDRKYMEVPFCVLVVDNKYTGIEIVDGYNPSKFKMALFVEDPALSKKMKSFFNTMWHEASKEPPRITVKT